MTLEAMFPNAAYEMIANDPDNPATFAQFYVPRGYWYSTDADTVAKQAVEETYIHVPVGGYLRMVDPKAVPLSGVWYYWE